MNITLLKREMKYNLKILLIFSAILTLYTTMVILMYDPGLKVSLEVMKESMPQIFAAVGMGNDDGTLAAFIINYLFGLFFKLFPMIFFIILVNRVLIRYVDRGSIAYFLATPNSRWKIVITQAATVLFQILLLLVYLTVLMLAVSESKFPGELDIPGLLLAMVGLFGLLFCLSGICFLSGCIFNDSGLALGVGAGLNILFMVIQMIAQVGEKFENLKYLTLMTLFQPTQIVAGETEGIVGFLILYLVGILCYGAGIFVFARKDFSV